MIGRQVPRQSGSMVEDGAEYDDEGATAIPDSDQCSIPSARLKEARFNENRTAGKAAIWSVLEFYRRMWLVIGNWDNIG